MNIGVVAGEASGDLLGAALLKELAVQDTWLQASGVAGQHMRAAGCRELFDSQCLSMMGWVPVRHLLRLYKLHHQLYRHFCQYPPDVFIGIDAPDFNLALESKLRRRGIRTVHYVSPSVWAWRQYRLRKIKHSVDLMLTLFPFETDFYQQYDIPVCYVGHPLADIIPLESDTQAARQRLGLDNQAWYVAVLPGSRQQELDYLAGLFLQAAECIWQHDHNVQFISSLVHADHHALLTSLWHKQCAHLPLRLFLNRSHDVLAAADVVLIKSGTGTLEAMLFKKPMVIAYRMQAWVYLLLKQIVHVSYCGLPNLLANELLVPEFVQHDCTPKNLADAVLTYRYAPDRCTALQRRFMTLHQQLRCHTAEKAVSAILAVSQGVSH